MYEFTEIALMVLAVYLFIVLPVAVKHMAQIEKERNTNVTQDHFDNFVGKD